MPPIRPSHQDPTLAPTAATLAAHAARLDRMGWMLGTSGSLSARLASDPLTLLITVSGKGKGDLTTADFLIIEDDGEVFSTLSDPQASSAALFAGQPRPSGETLVHEAIYRRFPKASAVYHVHSVEATLCGQLIEAGQHLRFEGLEMLKGLGRWEPGAQVLVPVVSNDPSIPALAALVAQAADPAVPGVLVQGHGTYVWGEDAARALRHVEILEFLFQYALRCRALGL
jgi:methylthioribulose-1-phosphate dehydratase